MPCAIAPMHLALDQSRVEHRAAVLDGDDALDVTCPVSASTSATTGDTGVRVGLGRVVAARRDQRRVDAAGLAPHRRPSRLRPRETLGRRAADGDTPVVELEIVARRLEAGGRRSRGACPDVAGGPENGAAGDHGGPAALAPGRVRGAGRVALDDLDVLGRMPSSSAASCATRRLVPLAVRLQAGRQRHRCRRAPSRTQTASRYWSPGSPCRPRSRRPTRPARRTG